MKKDKTAAARKQRQRQKEKALGLKLVSVKLSQKELAQLEDGCRIRGGVSGPYDVDEYLATLIRLDHEKLLRDVSRLDKCTHCGLDLPGGCGGDFDGMSECWHTSKARALRLA